jgi:hydrogenase/urease accessory protein HupE
MPIAPSTADGVTANHLHCARRIRCGNRAALENHLMIDPILSHTIVAPLLRIRSVVLLWFCLCLWPAAADAHEIRPAVVTVTFGQTAFDVEISANVEAMIAGVSPRHSDTSESPNAKTYDQLRALEAAALEERVRAFAPELARGIAIDIDGVRIVPDLVDVRIPETGDVKVARISVLHLRGELPAGAKEFRWSMNRELGDNALRLREVREGSTTTASTWLSNGEWSDPYVIGQGLRARSTAEVIAQYAVLGFTHILPKGLDHILFVLGLYLLSTRWKPLLVQVTSFTVAHSITLGLSIYGIFSLPASIVEPLIALSIAYVAIENVMTSRLRPWRPVVVFAFGLLHGMGFAGVLQEVGLPRSEFATALVAFNVGVELGQLAVITLAFVTTGLWLRDRPWYRRRVVIPASIAIAAVGLYWTVERVLDLRMG